MCNCRSLDNKRTDFHIEEIKKIVDKKCDLLNNASYEIGSLGASLFYVYYSLYKKEDLYLDRALELFKTGIKQLDIKNFKPVFATDSLDNHLSNIGRYIAFLKDNEIVDLDAENYLNDVDYIITHLTIDRLKKGNFDIHGGAMAGGYYFLTRDISQRNIKDNLIRIVDSLELHSCEDVNGSLYWRSPLLGNRVYLGISHGSALIISFLTRLYENGIEEGRCKRLIYKGIDYVLANVVNYQKGLFPHFIGDEEIGVKQFSLCYGDLGIGYSIFRSGQILSEENYLRDGMAILVDCLNRSKDDNVTLDASLVYGASGLAEAFSKIFTISGNLKFEEAAQYWYSKIPEYAVNSNNFLGYKSKLVDAGDIWDLSFGWGILGIGISLMRYVDPKLPPLSPLLFIA